MGASRLQIVGTVVSEHRQNVERGPQAELQRAFVRQVVVDSSMCFLFKHGLGSDVPGTTKFDEVASATVNGYIKERFDEEKHNLLEPAHVGTFFDAMKNEVNTRFGLIFKEGSFVTSLFSPDQSSYSFEFLGQTLVRVSGTERFHYIPKPAQRKLIIAATTFKKAYKSPIIKQKCSMSKFRSLYAGGGFLHPILANRLKAIYASMYNRGLRPMSEEDEEFVNESERDVFVDIDFGEDDGFPTSEWCLNLYLPVDDQVHEDHAITLDERLTSTTSELGKVESADFELDDFSSEESENEVSAQLGAEFKEKMSLNEAKARAALNPTDWATRMDHERVEQDKGSVELPTPKQVAPSTMQQRQPLPDEVKREFEAREAEKRAKIREQRVFNAPPVKKAARAFKDNKRGKGSRNDQGITGETFEDNDYDVSDQE